MLSLNWLSLLSPDDSCCVFFCHSWLYDRRKHSKTLSLDEKTEVNMTLLTWSKQIESLPENPENVICLTFLVRICCGDIICLLGSPVPRLSSSVELWSCPDITTKLLHLFREFLGSVYKNWPGTILGTHVSESHITLCCLKIKCHDKYSKQHV